MTRGAGAGRAAGAQGVRGRASRRAWARGRALQAAGRAGARQQAQQQARRVDARACKGALVALRHGSLALRHGLGARPRHGQATHDTATSARPMRRLGQLGQVGVLCTLTQFLDPV